MVGSVGASALPLMSLRGAQSALPTAAARLRGRVVTQRPAEAATPCLPLPAAEPHPYAARAAAAYALAQAGLPTCARGGYLSVRA